MTLLTKIWHVTRFIPALIVGYFVPLEVSSVTFLRQQLHRYGIPALAIPTSCIRELAHETLKIARLGTKYGQSDIQSSLVYGLEYRAERIAEILTGNLGQWDDQLRRDARAHLINILNKYGVKVQARTS
ncbi:MAG TPA: hypothetical protein VH000_12340 [Rhizomicrobium sp.]|jgi:hypothetical protein|nr:hypothetical protein [Rhizomicrobium sp.]